MGFVKQFREKTLNLIWDRECFPFSPLHISETV
jgi:hypothetical protein